MRVHAAWFVYAAMAAACVAYVDSRARLVPKWGEWYAPGASQFTEADPVVLFQVRAFLSGRLALFPHPVGTGVDSFWGRGGVHSGWGLGVPILATPLHLVARAFGAPGFPDSVRFLLFYAATAIVLARALHRASPRDPNALFASTVAAGFVMVFPTFVGMISARFLVYEQTIATGALWSVLLLAGILALVHRCSTGRLVTVCAAAGFAAMIRPSLGAYGLATLVLALIIAFKKRMGPRDLLWAFAAYAAVEALYPLSNALRFGSPFTSGYENCTSGAPSVRAMRWGSSFMEVPFTSAAKEMFATLFLLEPTTDGAVPPTVQPYVVGERWRSFYTPTFDLVILWTWIAAIAIVFVRVVRGRLWRRDKTIDSSEVMTVVGAWALAPVLILFVFYARLVGYVTRYATDMYPAFAAAGLCVGMTIVEAVRKRAPLMTASAQLAIAGAVALYLSGTQWRGWPEHQSRPWDRKTLLARIAERDARSREMPPVPDHFICNQQPPGPDPVYGHLDDWMSDCSFTSGMVFALPHKRCVSFTFNPARGTWDAAADEALAGFRAKADFDTLVSCRAPSVEVNTRRITMCDPHPPAFLLDGMRLYAIASLDEHLNPISDRLRLMQIEAVPACQ